MFQNQCSVASGLGVGGGGGESPNVSSFLYTNDSALEREFCLRSGKPKNVAIATKWQKLKVRISLQTQAEIRTEAKRLATSSLYSINLRNKHYLALLKVTSPKTEEPVTSSSNLSQHHIFCALYFCRTSLRLEECAFFVPLHLGFIISIDVWTHTHKQTSMKEDLDPSSATLYVITTSVKCKEKPILKL